MTKLIRDQYTINFVMVGSCSLYKVFPSMDPENGGRTPMYQALYQLSALGMTLGTALLSGALTGQSSR